MKRYDVYGVKSKKFEPVIQVLEKNLGIKFKPHDSIYHGGRYYRSGKAKGDENFVVKKNFNPIDQEWEEEDFRQMDLLLFVNNTDRGDELKNIIEHAIPDTVIIRKKEIADQTEESNSDLSHAVA